MISRHLSVTRFLLLGAAGSLKARQHRCGRPLQKIAVMPKDTKLYCAHEYTQANAAFAVTVDPMNDALKKRAAEIDQLRADGIPTVPTNVAVELATNPFMRAEDAQLKAALGLSGADAVENICRDPQNAKTIFNCRCPLFFLFQYTHQSPGRARSLVRYRQAPPHH